MQQVAQQPNPFSTLIMFALIMVPMIIAISRLAKEKGKNVILWTILACIPFVNFFIIPYIVGTPSKTQDEKLNMIIELLNKDNQNNNSTH
ncbi:hypothetical protein CYCD_20720 [Tenuifilaceae bacterium CYCD]|nr:hypothetical protein CYCD_20720 [Tenuifilaceae bacterium CYCD]